MEFSLFLVAAIILLTVALCSGEHQASVVCLGAPTTAPRPLGETPSLAAAEELTRDGLARRLQERQFTVEAIGAVQQPFFRAEGSRLWLSGTSVPLAEIQTYAYAPLSVASADARRITPEGEASWIGPDGTDKGMKIAWAGTPHFYRSGRLIALYVGTDPALIALLDEQFGPQFAGR